jgi:hypothetical protein
MTRCRHERKRRAWRRDVWTRERSRLANAAKARKRLAADREPVMVPWCRYTVTVRDRLTGETGTFELRSVRDAARRLAVLLRYYQ